MRTVLRNGQTVEIITAKGAMPNPSWVNFVVTAKARGAIRHYLKSLRRTEAIALGQRDADFVRLDGSGARSLIDLDVRLVGIDYLSIGDDGSHLMPLRQHIPDLVEFAKSTFTGTMPHTGTIGRYAGAIIEELIEIGAVPAKPKRREA